MYAGRFGLPLSFLTATVRKDTEIARLPILDRQYLLYKHNGRELTKCGSEPLAFGFSSSSVAMFARSPDLVIPSTHITR